MKSFSSTSPWITTVVATLSFILLSQISIQIMVRLSDTRAWLAALALGEFSGKHGRVAGQSIDEDVGWYPPSKSQVNADFNEVLDGRGTWGFIYDSSRTPDGEYGVYNWCNMPHVRKTEYVKAPEGYQLRYVELIHRHHKRTPYASNAFPVEPYHWDCDDQGLFYYGERLGHSSDESRHPSARGYWKVYVSPVNPFVPAGWKGTCQFPQITAEGLDDSWVHGRDLAELYRDELGFLPNSDDADWSSKVEYRVTNNQITSQVAGLLISGMWGNRITDNPTKLHIQAAGIDSLEPQYRCPRGSSLFNRIRSGENPAWRDHLRTAGDLYAALDDISGVPTNQAHFHASFDPYYDNLSARQCHSKPLPCKVGSDGDGGSGGSTRDCISQDLADSVYRIGHWEYSQIYRDHPDSLAASVATYGVWIAELASHIRDVVRGEGSTIWRHNIAHDGSVSRVLSILQVEEMVWPGMGAEIIFEVYEKASSGGDDTQRAMPMPTSTSTRDGGDAIESGFYVRVLFGGQVLRSSSPVLGQMDMVPVERVLGYFDGLVGVDGSLVRGLCEGG